MRCRKWVRELCYYS